MALVPAPGALAAPGGGEIQLFCLNRALWHRGITADVSTADHLQLRKTDCVHLFGSCPEHLKVVDAAQRVGVPVVLSPIAWFDLAARWFAEGSLSRRLKSSGGLLARTAIPWLLGWRHRLYHSADVLLPNSQVEAAQLARLFRVPPGRIQVVPNGTDERFASGDGRAFADRVGLREFVLCVGRIEPRKNQHRLLRAMRGTGISIVLIGGVVPGHESYLARCKREADENVFFLGHVAHDAPLLADAYAACGCLALVSWFETPGLAALEAAATGTPLVLTDRGATREYFGAFADYASPRDERDIRENICAALERPRDPALARLVQTRYTWDHAAEATCDAYQQVIARR